MVRFYSCLILLLFVSVTAFSQNGQNGEDCEITLNRATDEFNAGHFSGIDSLLTKCLRSGFSREQQQRAYLLLTHVYLLLDRSDKAEESYLKLLRANPEFQTDPARDPIEVVYLSKKFTSDPIFSVFGKIGGNFSFVKPIKEISITGEEVKNGYFPKIGWNVMAGAEYHVRNPFSIGAELNFVSAAYRHEQSSLWYDGGSRTESLVRLTSLTIPVYFKYTHVNSNKIRPYAYAGVAANLLIADRESQNSSYRVSPNSSSVSPYETAIQDYSYKRKAFSKSLILGGGLQYKWNLDYLFGEVRFAYGLDNLYTYELLDYSQSSTNGLHADYTVGPTNSGLPLWGPYYQDDFFRLSNLYVVIGYRHPLYKPRKLKKARTNAVLRDVKQLEDNAE